MNEIIKSLIEEGLIFPAQIVLLVINAYFLINGPNYFILLSSIILLSIFVLQSVRRRFLLLFPKNGFAYRNTSSLDTFYLKLIIIASTFLSVTGIALKILNKSLIFDSINQCEYWYLWYGIPAVIFLLAAPIFFWRKSEWINDRIANDLKNYGSHTFSRKCVFSGSHYCIQENEVIDKNTGKIKFSCPICEKTFEQIVALNIGQ